MSYMVQKNETEMNLNLITPQKSEIAFKSFTFPDGQPHLQLEVLPANTKHVHILTRLSTMNDVFLCLAAKNALDYAGVETVDVTISYLMAARMDRVMTEGEPFSLKIVADMLNAGQFRKVRIFDPHSDVATALVHRSVAISNVTLVKKAMEAFPNLTNTDGYYLVSPDSGALKKVYKIAASIGAERVAECIKFRDVKTGQLSGFKTFEEDFGQRPCFIIDDICDGGGTFAGLAALLKSRNAGKVLLVVSHGIFSRGFDIAGIDGIVSTNSFKEFTETPPSVRIFPVESVL